MDRHGSGTEFGSLLLLLLVVRHSCCDFGRNETLGVGAPPAIDDNNSSLNLQNPSGAFSYCYCCWTKQDRMVTLIGTFVNNVSVPETAPSLPVDVRDGEAHCSPASAVGGGGGQCSLLGMLVGWGIAVTWLELWCR
jgi:hypothetical protein